MSSVFLRIVSMSISASYVLLSVLLLRLLLRKAPKWIPMILWGIVAFRLICPFSLESPFGILPATEPVSPTIMTDSSPSVDLGIPMLNDAINPVLGQSFSPNPGDSANPLQILIPIFTTVWLLGAILLFSYALISYIRIRRRVATAVLWKDNIYRSENAAAPFVLGIIRPKIYIPFHTNEQDAAHILAHETEHIRRRDHLWKPLGFLLLSLHWFNPLMWLGYALLCRDIELACDERVIRELDRDARADYSQALLTFSSNRHAFTACPLAFGEVGVKRRIKSVFRYRRPALWIVAAAVLVCIAAALCLLTSSRQSVRETLIPNTAWVCESCDLTFRVSSDYVAEGELNAPGYSGTVSIGYRYGGKIAVAEIFRGDWEYAQAAAEEPLLKGKFRAEDGTLIFEVEEDPSGSFPQALIFRPAEPTNPSASGEIHTDYAGVYVTLKSIDTDPGGHLVFNVVWHNQTDQEIMFGDQYRFERLDGYEWIDTASESIHYDNIGHVLHPNRELNRSYSSEKFDLSEGGIYRLKIPFSVGEGNGRKTHYTSIHFTQLYGRT